MKQCSKCKLSLPYNKFSKGTNPGGYASYCKECAHKYYSDRYERKTKKMKVTFTHKQCRLCEELLELNMYASYNKTYCKKCSSYLGHKRVLERYHLTTDQYVDMLKAQDYKCAICKKETDSRLQVDHDHDCCPGQYTCGNCIRGLLCSHCNRTLGMAFDSIENLENMISYLKSHI
jgi:hypothetical protein